MKKNIFLSLIIVSIVGSILFSVQQVSTKEVDIPEGALIRTRGTIDIYIVKYSGSKKFKRLILSPTVFNSYEHLRWDDVMEVEQAVTDSFIVSDLVRVIRGEKIYKLYPQGDTGEKRWIKELDAFYANEWDLDAVYEINSFDRDSYLTGPDIESKVSDDYEPSGLPDSFSLNIPFIIQAPFGNWNSPFDQTCEETSILMVYYYFQNKTVDYTEVVRELYNIVSFQERTYGFYKDTSAEETAQLVRDYYGYKANVYFDVSALDIKRELVKGNPVVVPLAGRLLNNPYFTALGPLYHMAVIKGYNQDGFIVHDPGTKRGADFFYSYQIIDQALHDFNYGDVLNGKSAMISIER